MHNKDFFSDINDINLPIFKYVFKRHKKLGLGVTPVQSRIIMYIYENNGSIYQKDIESFISCNKSTLSAVLNTMKKNDLISKEESSRKNIIKLTSKSLEIVDILKKDNNESKEIISNGISEDEYKIFKNVLDKIKNNIEREN